VALVIGMLGAWAKLCSTKALNRAGDVYTTVVRSVPELLLILLIFYAGMSALTRLLIVLRLADEGLQLNPMAGVIAALSLVYGAYLTDVLRGGIQAVPKGQIEAAKAYGMHGPMRFLRILFPQMIRFALPGMSNQWLNITKDSALVSVVGVIELVQVGKGAAFKTKHFFFFFGVTGLMYLALTIVSLFLLGRLEKRANRGVRRV
jgi:His/Glu/Gln/Arg/opine family amino acid ABC transporter permease subunit